MGLTVGIIVGASVGTVGARVGYMVGSNVGDRDGEVLLSNNGALGCDGVFVDENGLKMRKQINATVAIHPMHDKVMAMYLE